MIYVALVGVPNAIFIIRNLVKTFFIVEIVGRYESIYNSV